MRGAARAVALAGLVAAAAIAAAAPAPPTVEIAVSRRGFEPSRVGVRRGEAVRIVVTSRDVEHCFAVDALRVEKRVVPGRPVRVDLVPEQAGEFPFHCCLESGSQAELERGVLVVSE
jgi:heme/copper-type cytochrome/quinol oxidase subunit 2